MIIFLLQSPKSGAAITTRRVTKTTRSGLSGNNSGAAISMIGTPRGNAVPGEDISNTYYQQKGDAAMAKHTKERFSDITLRRTEDGCVTNVPHRIVRHSPTGFAWGYGGSGASDLALNMLLLFTDENTANSLYQNFKWDVISRIPYEGGTIPAGTVAEWLSRQMQESEADNAAD